MLRLPLNYSISFHLIKKINHDLSRSGRKEVDQHKAEKNLFCVTFCNLAHQQYLKCHHREWDADLVGMGHNVCTEALLSGAT